MMIVRRQVAFNLDNPHHRELNDWINEQTTNFSGFVRDVLFAQKNNRQISAAPQIKVAPTSNEGIFDIL